MSIPLDHLYHYIDQCAQDSFGDLIIVYRFDPHGSKAIKDLSFLNDYTMEDVILYPQVFCYDQEPLDFDRYEQETFLDTDSLNLVKSHVNRKMNLRDYPANAWDRAILLHSEQRSPELDLYGANAFIPVYYWSHALIGLDWFRSAEYLRRPQSQIKKTFLIYNRAWSGTREYRLKFADDIINLSIQQQCKMSICPRDLESQQHYSEHSYKNPNWIPSHCLENYFPITNVASTYSAVIDFKDYAETEIEVVLETLFDDSRLHLTEKTLRPIACGQPFVLLATYGSLQYLRNYGFQTYENIWPETYDQIQDSSERMQEVLRLMKTIAQWDAQTRHQKMELAREIAEFNRQHFFSNNFKNLIISELQTNLDRAFAELTKHNTSQYWLETQNLRYELAAPRAGSMLCEFSPDDWSRIVNRVQSQVQKHST